MSELLASNASVADNAVPTLLQSSNCRREVQQRVSQVLDSEHGVAIDSLDRLPKEWQPSVSLLVQLSSKAWASAEQEEADSAVEKGLDEMIVYQTEHPETISELWSDSIEAFIDTAFAADNMPNLRDKALRMARRNLEVLAIPYISGGTAEAPSASEFLTLVTYAHTLSMRLASDLELKLIRGQLIRKTNESIAACGSLQDVMGFDYIPLLSDADAFVIQDIYDLVMWAMLWIDAMAISELTLPPGIDSFVKEVWRYLAAFGFQHAVEFSEGVNDADFYELAYLLTHVAYMPTGYGRHRLQVKTAPWLYTFVRANFYAIMEMGELDLFAEFVDILRQYGCSEWDDRQVRDGSRYLLALYRRAGRAWMNYREYYEPSEIDPYDLMHKPWTAIAGLRQRKFEPVERGTYGDVAQRLLAVAVAAPVEKRGVLRQRSLRPRKVRKTHMKRPAIAKPLKTDEGLRQRCRG